MAGRPYGIGIYGTGRYGIGTAATAFEVAGQSSITLQAFAKPTMVYAGTGAATSITLQPQAAFIRITQPAAATQISFSIQARPNIIHQVAGRTQISFSVQGELVKTWQDPGPCFVPCEAGTWTQTFPPWTQRPGSGGSGGVGPSGGYGTGRFGTAGFGTRPPTSLPQAA